MYQNSAPTRIRRYLLCMYNLKVLIEIFPGADRGRATRGGGTVFRKYSWHPYNKKKCSELKEIRKKLENEPFFTYILAWKPDWKHRRNACCLHLDSRSSRLKCRLEPIFSINQCNMPETFSRNCYFEFRNRKLC